MKKLALIFAVCIAFCANGYAAHTTSGVTATSISEQQSLVEKYKSYINRLYQAATNDDYQTFERLLREFESFCNNTPSSQIAQIEEELTEWAKTNGYKMIVISEYSEYAEDVREGRIQR